MPRGDAMRSAAARATSEVHEDLLEAFGLVSTFFALPSFHEDFVFEPLIEVEAVRTPSTPSMPPKRAWPPRSPPTPTA